MHKKISFWIGVFFVQVVFFAFVYWLCWGYHPDYFIVNQELNLQPLEELLILRNMDFPQNYPPKQSDQIESLDALQSVSEGKMNEFFELNNELLELEPKLATLNNEKQLVYEEIELSEQENYKIYHDEIMQPYITEKKTLEDEINDLNSIVDTSTDSFSKQVLLEKLSTLTFQRAQLNVEFAEKEYELSSERISQREKFLDQEVNTRLDNILSQIDQVEKRRFAVRNKIYNLKSEAYKDWIFENNKRTRRLGYLDFIYFSMSVSIANTFGDILPNHLVIRSIVTGQFVICLILLGLIINFLIGRITQSMGGNNLS